jgi:hypothetical protein
MLQEIAFRGTSHVLLRYNFREPNEKEKKIGLNLQEMGNGNRMFTDSFKKCIIKECLKEKRE